MPDRKRSFKNIVLFAGLPKNEFKKAAPEFQRLNTSQLRLFSIITIVYLAVLFLSTFQNSVSILNRNIYIVSTALCVLVLSLSYMKFFCNQRAIIILVYVFLATIFSLGIGIGATQHTQPSGAFLVFIMTAPLLFYDKPYRVGILILLYTILFLMVSIYTKTPEATDTDMLNGICFGTLSLVLNTANLSLRCERVWYGSKMRAMAETDTLTRLKNRNSFEHSYREYAEKAKNNVICIFADVNGLHDLNNTEGHEAGDQMLQFIAVQLLAEFGPDDTYRMGGDEYVVMLRDQDEEVTRKRIERVMKVIEDHQYHISVGIASFPAAGIDMDALIKAADKKMYEAKRQYYHDTGKDRRKR
ncbi:MAG: GGDEF domain-containing protein [Treponemataceae bacterium]|nr:GGDEF domain-containing protein [Treponemataceae bacterium]